MNVEHDSRHRIALHILALSLGLIGSVFLVGCHTDTKSQIEEQVESNSTSRIDATQLIHEGERSSAHIVIRDRLKREVTLPGVPQRIVSLAPATTELVFAIGAGASLVGVTKNCNYPEAALQLPRVGSGTTEGISRETILSLKPDLVLGKWDTHQPLVEFFERVGIPMIAIGPESLDELFEEAKLLGRATGHSKDADALVQHMMERHNRLLARVASIELEHQKTVFYEVWDEPLMTAGPKSFIGEMLNKAKMRNIFEDTETRYPRISSEVVVDRNPDVILAPTTHMKQVEFARMAARAGWANITAISQKQVFLINGDQVSRCGPRLLDAMEEMIDCVYPETKVNEVKQP